MHAFAHLQDQPDAEEEVLVVDFDNMAVIEGVVTNVSEWGCRLSSPDVGELYKSIGIRPNGEKKLAKAQVTSVKGENAAIVFSKAEQAVSDKRREKRNNVKIQVTISDLEGITEIKGTIVDAGNNGCRILAKGLPALPEEVVLQMSSFDRPVVGEFAWRTESSGGLRLLWDRTLEESGVTGGDGEADEAAVA